MIFHGLCPRAPRLASSACSTSRLRKLARWRHVPDERLLAHKERAVVNAFDTFMRRWPEESGSLQANLDSAPDFFARLKRLEDDGLPEHETRFRNLLSQQSTQRLAELSRHVTEGRREITLRLDDVNEALYAVPYNHDSYLRINPVDLHLVEVSEFRERLRQIFADQGRQSGEDLVQAEQQFQLLRQLVMDLLAAVDYMRMKSTCVRSCCRATRERGCGWSKSEFLGHMPGRPSCLRPPHSNSLLAPSKQVVRRRGLPEVVAQMGSDARKDAGQRGVGDRIRGREAELFSRRIQCDL